MLKTFHRFCIVLWVFEFLPPVWIWSKCFSLQHLLFKPLLLIAFFVLNTTALIALENSRQHHSASAHSPRPVSLSWLPHCFLLNMQSSEEVFGEKSYAKLSGYWLLLAKSVCQKVLDMKLWQFLRCKCSAEDKI